MTIRGRGRFDRWPAEWFGRFAARPALIHWQLVLLAVALCGCQPDPRPNILLVTLDTTRADRIGAMGDASAQTPTLDTLAARGTVFERAFASVPLTLPSHTTILTGLDPTQHGVHDNGVAVPVEIETAVQRLSASGYATAAFVAAFVLDASFGLDRGFDHYDDEIAFVGDPLKAQVPQRSGREVTDRALRWLEGREKKPLFLWVHYYDAHTPREPEPPFDQVEDLYAAEISGMDAQLSRLFEGFAELSGESLILVVGDHGESLGEHDEATHGIVAYDSTLHVPLIVVGAGFAPGSRSSALVGTRDVAPTLLAAAGEISPAAVAGVPLQQLISSSSQSRAAYFESRGPSLAFGWSPIGGIRQGQWKYTAEPAPIELFDTLSDPGETINLAEREPAVVTRLEQAYQRFRGRLQEESDARTGLSVEILQQLAELGYVTALQKFESGAKPDPRRLVGSLALIDTARGLALEGRFADSIQALEILATSPAVRAVALLRLAYVYLAADRPRDAAGAFEELLGMAPSKEFQLGLAHALLAAGDPQSALDALGNAGGDIGEPSHREVLLRGRVLLALGDAAGALQIAGRILGGASPDDQVLALASRARAVLNGTASEIVHLESWLATADADRSWTDLRVALARMYRAERRDRDAVRVLEASLPDPQTLGLLAEIAAANGNPQRAVELYEAVLVLRPSLHRDRRELADLYRGLGRGDEARPLYDELVAAFPRDASLLLERGAIHLAAGQVVAAAQDFQRATELAPELPEAFFNLALVELRSDRESSAVQHFLRVLELRPSYAKANLQLARLYRIRGDPRARSYAERGAAATGGALPAAPAP